MPSDTAHPAIRLALCAITDVGRVRDNNEDAFVAINLDRNATFAEIGVPVEAQLGPRGVVLAVSDGMGGAQAGEVASALVLKTLDDSLRAVAQPTDEALRGAVEQANRAVFESSRDPARRGMGATLTAMLVHGRSAYIASVGDSRAYLLRGARFRRMTRDQSYVQVLVDAGVIDSQEAELSPMKNIVLQSMGQKPDVQVALGRLQLYRGDRLLLCSDGLTGHLKDPEIALEVARRDVRLDQIARILVDRALERGGEDNITVLVAEVNGEGLERAEMPESVTQTFEVLSEFEPSMPEPSRRSSAPSSPSAAIAPPPATPVAAPQAAPAPVAPRAGISGRVVVAVLLLGVVAIAAALAMLR